MSIKSIRLKIWYLVHFFTCRELGFIKTYFRAAYLVSEQSLYLEEVTALTNRLCSEKPLNDGDVKYYLGKKELSYSFILYWKILVLLLMKSVAKPWLTQLEVWKLGKSELKGDLIFLYISFISICFSQWFLENKQNYTDLKGNWFSSSNILRLFSEQFQIFATDL